MYHQRNKKDLHICVCTPAEEKGLSVCVGGVHFSVFVCVTESNVEIQRSPVLSGGSAVCGSGAAAGGVCSPRCGYLVGHQSHRLELTHIHNYSLTLCSCLFLRCKEVLL